METACYLVRHAQAQPLPTVPDHEWALSRRGEEQAQGLVRVLGPLGIEHVYCSPFRRCRDTLGPFAHSSQIPLTIHQGLRERCLGVGWIGDFRSIWQRSWQDFSFALEGGESSSVCRERMAAAVAEIIGRHPGGTVAIGSHGNSIGLLLTTIDPAFGVAEASALRTPELLRVVHDGTSLHWDRDFRPGPEFDAIATDFRLTPGIVA